MGRAGLRTCGQQVLAVFGGKSDRFLGIPTVTFTISSITRATMLSKPTTRMSSQKESRCGKQTMLLCYNSAGILGTSRT